MCDAQQPPRGRAGYVTLGSHAEVGGRGGVGVCEAQQSQGGGGEGLCPADGTVCDGPHTSQSHFPAIHTHLPTSDLHVAVFIIKSQIELYSYRLVHMCPDAHTHTRNVDTTQPRISQDAKLLETACNFVSCHIRAAGPLPTPTPRHLTTELTWGWEGNPVEWNKCSREAAPTGNTTDTLKARRPGKPAARSGCAAVRGWGPTPRTAGCGSCFSWATCGLDHHQDSALCNFKEA